MTNEDLTYDEIGRAFVLALASSSALGHVSCAGLADYAEHADLPESSTLILDAFAATRLDDRAYPAQARIREWLSTHPLGLLASSGGAEAAGRIG